MTTFIYVGVEINHFRIFIQRKQKITIDRRNHNPKYWSWLCILNLLLTCFFGFMLQLFSTYQYLLSFSFWVHCAKMKMDQIHMHKSFVLQSMWDKNWKIISSEPCSKILRSTIYYAKNNEEKLKRKFLYYYTANLICKVGMYMYSEYIVQVNTCVMYSMQIHIVFQIISILNQKIKKSKNVIIN